MANSLRNHLSCRRCWRPVLEQRGDQLYCPTCGASWSKTLEIIAQPSVDIYLRSMDLIVRAGILNRREYPWVLEELLGLDRAATTEQWFLASHHLGILYRDYRRISEGTDPINLLSMPSSPLPFSKRSSPGRFHDYYFTYLRSSSSPFTSISDDAFQILMIPEVKASLPWPTCRLYQIERRSECFSFPERTRRHLKERRLDWHEALDELFSAGLIKKAPIEANMRLVPLRRIRLKLKEYGVKGGTRKEEAVSAAVQSLPSDVLYELIEPVQGYVLTPVAIEEFRLRAYGLPNVHDEVREDNLFWSSYKPHTPMTEDDLLESKRKERGPRKLFEGIVELLQNARKASNYAAYLENGHPPIEGHLAHIYTEWNDFETAYHEVKQAYMLDVKYNDVSQLANISHFASLTKLRLQIEMILTELHDSSSTESLSGQDTQLESNISETENTLKMWISLYDRGSRDGFTPFLSENYEDIFARCGDLSRDSENKYREMVGVPRIGEGWISEVELLNLVRDILPREKVIHQASPEWLGLQRLDIFVPKLKIAIEYQGRQHYEPVPFFGGEEAFLETQKRDRRKAQLCTNNGIALIYFRYDEPITQEIVQARIEEVLVTQRAEFR